ncbi:hypothetical protein VP01_3174g1 [Puccinia sorghi]|uniref:Uncharacterized protein n=1 Tax=Puccinia sorghi TaxID=27349 RepID=A0A0L6UYM1_9BASI|nr:hypothetical protein VP01_3174g1 [Puccinia sorghi]
MIVLSFPYFIAECNFPFQLVAQDFFANPHSPQSMGWFNDGEKEIYSFLSNKPLSCTPHSITVSIALLLCSAVELIVMSKVVDNRLLTGGFGKPLASPRGGYRIITIIKVKYTLFSLVQASRIHIFISNSSISLLGSRYKKITRILHLELNHKPRTIHIIYSTHNTKYPLLSSAFLSASIDCFPPLSMSFVILTLSCNQTNVLKGIFLHKAHKDRFKGEDRCILELSQSFRKCNKQGNGYWQKEGTSLKMEMRMNRGSKHRISELKVKARSNEGLFLVEIKENFDKLGFFQRLVAEHRRKGYYCASRKRKENVELLFVECLASTSIKVDDFWSKSVLLVRNSLVSFEEEALQIFSAYSNQKISSFILLFFILSLLFLCCNFHRRDLNGLVFILIKIKPLGNPLIIFKPLITCFKIYITSILENLFKINYLLLFPFPFPILFSFTISHLFSSSHKMKSCIPKSKVKRKDKIRALLYEVYFCLVPGYLKEIQDLGVDDEYHESTTLICISHAPIFRRTILLDYVYLFFVLHLNVWSFYFILILIVEYSAHNPRISPQSLSVTILSHSSRTFFKTQELKSSIPQNYFDTQFNPNQSITQASSLDPKSSVR